MAISSHIAPAYTTQNFCLGVLFHVAAQTTVTRMGSESIFGITKLEVEQDITLRSMTGRRKDTDVFTTECASKIMKLGLANSTRTNKCHTTGFLLWNIQFGSFRVE